MTCPCGSAAPYAACCGALHAGGAAATAEALMRSRYSAFAVGDPAYLLRSWHSSTRPKTLELDASQVWEQLEILQGSGGLFDAEGTVEFRATYRHRGLTQVLHERSAFTREGGLWVYLTALPLR